MNLDINYKLNMSEVVFNNILFTGLCSQSGIQDGFIDVIQDTSIGNNLSEELQYILADCMEVEFEKRYEKKIGELSLEEEKAIENSLRYNPHIYKYEIENYVSSVIGKEIYITDKKIEKPCKVTAKIDFKDGISSVLNAFTKALEVTYNDTQSVDVDKFTEELKKNIEIATGETQKDDIKKRELGKYTYKPVDLNNLTKLKVRNGMLFLDDVALTSTQSFNIKHDVNDIRVTTLNVELLVDYEGIF